MRFCNSECTGRERVDIHLLFSLATPVIFLGFAGVSRSLVKVEWAPSNFYLGIDLALAALANGIINVADIGSTLAQQGLENTRALSMKMAFNAYVLVLATGLLLAVMFIHQRLERLPDDFDGRRWRRGVWLGIVANGLGAGPLFLFILGRLKGTL